MTRTTFALLLVLAAVGCSPTRSPPPVAGLPPDAEQALVVARADGPFAVEVTGYERRDGRWRVELDTMPGVVGRKGFAGPDQKREGDGMTPSGVYPIRLAFGYNKSLDTRLTYRQATDNDFWIDDPASLEYNRWVTGKPNAKSFEAMRRQDDLYKLGAVIEYNTAPVTPGQGSAIFLHIWGGPDKPTAGCVALAETHVRAILGWLDPARRPVVALDAKPQ
jgi:L,D-peptidoglycan transpeptidase YkuD (ErfK/YbiS/YcfS/YnhG family)